MRYDNILIKVGLTFNCRFKMNYLKNNRIILICILYILGMIHFMIFLYDFFPIKSKYDGTIIEPPKELYGINLHAHKNYVPGVDRVIFMVIDGLRNDFVSEKDMPYVYTSIKKAGCPITTRAESPTVTMPRIKAMTTGALPQYIDIVLNFESTKVVEDSWLQRAKEAGKNIVFYGDNTWEKLYPNMFIRSEGTTSFFVTDFTEVDNNVTRHLDSELLHKNDWDILILHYLGLDHIGHIYGPFHELIKMKLTEMDKIIKRIHSHTKDDDNTIIIISGDHGMRDLGGHGGSSESEVLIPFLILNKPCRKYRNYEAKQTDIAPTLSALMGLPLPAHSIGKILHDFLPYHSIAQNLYYLHYNALNLIKINYDKYIKEFAEVFKDHVNYLQNKNNHSKAIINAYEEKIVDISNHLLRSSSNKERYSLLYLSFCALVFIWIMLFTSLNIQNKWIKFCYITLTVTIFICMLPENIISSSAAVIYCIILLGFIFYASYTSKFILPIKQNYPLLNFLIFATAFRTVSFLSSSYVEFEQNIWYFLWGSVCVFGAYGEIKKQSWIKISFWLCLFFGMRISRNINLIRAFELPNILQVPVEFTLTWPMFIIGLTQSAYICTNIYKSDILLSVLTSLANVAIFWHQVILLIDNQAVFMARIAMCLIVIMGLISFIKYRDIIKSFTITWILWITLLMRPYNVILIPMCIVASRIIFKLCTSIEILTLMHIWLEEVLYFSQGFDNSFSSVDLSAGYVGLTEYSLILTSFQVICHTYAFRILPLVLLIDKVKHSEKLKILHIFIIYRFSSFTYYCLVALIHRYHLFVWSVFSPKLLIEFCHGLNLLFIIIIYMLYYKFTNCKKDEIIKC